MPDIAKLVEKLQTGNRNARYEACEELRVADTITEEALQVLERASQDPDSGVADAARRALHTHRPPAPAPTPPPPLYPTGFPGQSTPSHPAPSMYSPPAPGPTVQMPPTAPNSPEYVFALEKRIIYLEMHISGLTQAVQSPSSQVKLPNTALLSPSFLSRAFAVWGHAIAAQLIIAVPLYVIIFLFALSG